MSDQLTERRRPARSWAGRRGQVYFVVSVVASYAVVGAVAGWLWHQIWNPSTGVVSQHVWYPDSAGLRGDFSGTGLYVIVALGAGLGLGLAFAFVGSRRAVLTLVAVALSSALAAWLMLRVGESLSPPDPDVLARTADDGKKLSSALRATGLSPLLSLPLGSLVALALVYLVLPGSSRESGFTEEPRG